MILSDPGHDKRYVLPFTKLSCDLLHLFFLVY